VAHTQDAGLPVAGVEREFVGWLQARAWVSAESQRALFARAAEHLIGLRVLLPGHSTLWRLVASVSRARRRAWLRDAHRARHRRAA
jgi:Domain of unknown function (DUF4158)